MWVSPLAADALTTVVARSLPASPSLAVAVRAADGSSAEVAKGSVGGTPLGVHSVMYGASIAKQVIGVLAAQMSVLGRLDPDEALARYLDDLPSWASEVRVRHLIHHTSGLPEVGRRADNSGNAEFLSRLCDMPGLAGEPGTTFRYSNVGYVCLAEVVRRLDGRPLDHLAQSTLFRPLGMTTARLGGAMPKGLQGQQQPPATLGDGGLWLSVRDLALWNDAMNRRALGSSVHALAEETGRLSDGTPLDYAWGIRVFQHGGRRTTSHGGSWPTWSSKTIRQPEQGVSVAILSTSDDAQAVTDVALALADELNP